MKEFDIKLFHDKFNSIYENCEKACDILKNKFQNISINMGSYKGHYIKINGEYVQQKYFMPVISIDNVGDVCFNLDGCSIEFFWDKNFLLNNPGFEKFINSKYEIEIYDAKDCTIDIYDGELEFLDLKNKLLLYSSNEIGCCVNCQVYSFEEIIFILSDIIQMLKLI